jgi:hypothetical protein
VPDDLIIARNPEEDSTLPYLIRIPLGPNGVVVKARETWPRATKVYCHRAAEWPADPEIIERLPVRSAARRGAAIDLVLTRARENRSQFVLTQARGREMIFWQTARTAKQARPRVTLPTARAHGEQLVIMVDTAEKYAYGFRHQQATTTRMRLAAGDYAVALDGQIVAAVERKTVDDLASSLLAGRLTYALAELAALPRAAVVVEAGYSKIFNQPFSSGAAVAEALAEAQARFPSVPVMFCENRAMAQEWTYRWLGACLEELQTAQATSELERTFATAMITEQPHPATPSAAYIRRWARDQGIAVPDKGRIPSGVRQAFADREGEVRPV